ncbi:hypothetical protein SNE40_018181 [Patella caerulea]
MQTANLEKLLDLPNVGRQKTEKIIALREKHGQLTLQMLLETPGLSKEKWEDFIVSTFIEFPSKDVTGADSGFCTKSDMTNFMSEMRGMFNDFTRYTDRRFSELAENTGHQILELRSEFSARIDSLTIPKTEVLASFDPVDIRSPPKSVDPMALSSSYTPNTIDKIKNVNPPDGIYRPGSRDRKDDPQSQERHLVPPVNTLEEHSMVPIANPQCNSLPAHQTSSPPSSPDSIGSFAVRSRLYSEFKSCNP